MKKHGLIQLMVGILIGALLFGVLPAAAAGVAAVLSTQPVTLNGKPVQITGYNIEGSNYFKLRDIGEILNINVWFDEAAGAVRIEPDKPANTGGPVTDNSSVSSPAATSGVYKIADYYNSNGKFSALGQALPLDDNNENVLTVKNGEIIIVGEKQYKVTAESLSLPFYTQPSLDKVFVWWTDCMNDWMASGKVENN